MQILFSPQMSDEPIHYVFEDEKIVATYKGITDTFDFSDFGDGVLQTYTEDMETGEVIETIETSLSIVPIIHAERKNGELFVRLLNFYDEEETDPDVLYPKWGVVSDG
ncbi:hypothetical protein [Oceanobacillus sp. FSL H7-0719]|uniref:hypothetical protein n=1 Tax=Oceanobacillus sp. FSL H7-0719 TaxID=2954507 RepID=UPI003254A22F